MMMIQALALIILIPGFDPIYLTHQSELKSTVPSAF